MEFSIPSERKKDVRPQLIKQDRVAAPATCWYKPDHPTCINFPKLYGTIITATDLSAKVFWDLDESTSTIATSKLEVLSRDAPLQFDLDGSSSDHDKSIFQPKSKSVGKKKMALKRCMTKDSSHVLNDKKSHSPVPDNQEDAGPSGSTSVDPIVNKFSKSVIQIRNVAVKGRKQNNAQTSKAMPKMQLKLPIGATSTKRTQQVLTNDSSGNDNSESDSSCEEDDSATSDKGDVTDISTAPKNSGKASKPDLYKFQITNMNFDMAAVEGHRDRGYGSKLLGLVNNKTASPLEHFILFLPREFLDTILLPEANTKGLEKYGKEWNLITFAEFLKLFGIMMFMETVVLPERRDYWELESVGPYNPQHMGRYMTRQRFEQILPLISSFLTPECIKKKELDQYWKSMNNLLTALTKQFQKVLIPGSHLTIDESMIKGYHRSLPGKVKIKRKPTPVGNEVLDLCDSETLIVLNMEFNEGKDNNSTKEFVKEFGVTTATALRLSKPYWGTGRVVYQDSWFGSVKTCEELLKRGVYSVAIVKTAHKNFPRELLAAKPLRKGEWISAAPTAEGAAKIWCCRYMDRKPFQFVASCSTSNDGVPRLDRHKNHVKRPKVASDYFASAGAIDRFNHCRTGGIGLEDAVKTKDPALRQMCGVLGFVATNSFRSYCHFTAIKKHKDFKKELVCLLLENKFDTASETSKCVTREKKRARDEESSILYTHILRRYPGTRNQKRCFYCYHGYDDSRIFRSVYYCGYCGEDYGLCPPTSGRICWELHIKFGLPMKRSRKKTH